ncbi:MAG: hypothetical protein A4E62_02790 [Syntrophorhabdus sp. PtaU1.Bin002]|nr:MAG: hypothetical protein A4E62_02790 [Syntrophorhabdus sp. PtaU1.Bin002]
MDKRKNIILAQGKGVKDEELSPREKEIQKEKADFRRLDKADQFQYINETACMFKYLALSISAAFEFIHSIGTPNDDEMCGLLLLFNHVGKRIKVSEAAVEE